MELGKLNVGSLAIGAAVGALGVFFWNRVKHKATELQQLPADPLIQIVRLRSSLTEAEVRCC